ncbi:MAG: hypothetical protein LBR80_18725 [Deltaproteobacteria bacterium]|nr:hypothetical protein [Deltaproteobacteria bacterium]
MPNLTDFLDPCQNANSLIAISCMTAFVVLSGLFRSLSPNDQSLSPFSGNSVHRFLRFVAMEYDISFPPLHQANRRFMVPNTMGRLAGRCILPIPLRSDRSGVPDISFWLAQRLKCLGQGRPKSLDP